MVRSYAQVSLARAPGSHFTVLLCFWGALSIVPFASVRAFANPAVALPNGIIGVLVCGVAVINSQFVKPLAEAWRKVCMYCLASHWLHGQPHILLPGAACLACSMQPACKPALPASCMSSAAYERQHQNECLIPLSMLAAALVQVMLHLIYDGIIAGVATIVTGALVLPTLAGDELRANIGDALEGLGHSISG